MNQKGFMNVILFVVVVLLLVAGVYFAFNRQTMLPVPILGPAPVPLPPPLPTPIPIPKACTQEAKQCPDGSYVGRTGPNCEFAKCPAIITPSIIECQKDSDFRHDFWRKSLGC